MVTRTAPAIQPLPRLNTPIGGELRRPPRWRRWLSPIAHPAVVAIAVWLLALPGAMLGPGILDDNPFTARAMMFPLAVGGVLLAGLGALAMLPAARGFREVLAGCCAGLFAAWIAITLRTALYGTPYGFDGLAHDKVRLTAMATRYSVTAASTDPLVPTVPGDHPPLFPWLVGRYAALTHTPAWQLIGPGEVLTMSAAVLVGFLLWRRVVPDFVALAASGVALLAFDTPSKAYAVIAVAAFVPWALSAFSPVPAGHWPFREPDESAGYRARHGLWPRRLHWLPAGVIGGLIVLSCYGYLVYAAPGLLALAIAGLRAAPSRRAYGGHLVRTGLVAFVVSSWFVVPYVATAVSGGVQLTAIRFIDAGTGTSAFPFLEPTALGVVEFIGLAGIVWYRESRTWARPLLFLLLGTYAFRLIMLLWLVVDGLDRQISDTTRLIGPLLAAAGVLTVATTAPRLARRFTMTPPSRLGAAVLMLLFAWIGSGYWQATMPADRPMERRNVLPPPSSPVTMAGRAHSEPLPGGGRPRYTPVLNTGAWLPVWRIRQEVWRRLGRGASPVTLSASERLFAFLPWPGYAGVTEGAASGLVRWDDRHREVLKLARTSDPREFARRSASTAFGPIEVFVLRKDGPTANFWRWREVQFQPAQFDPAHFDVVTDLPQDVVIAIRRR